METTNKYYTPSAEEFRIGFKYEINSPNEDNDWIQGDSLPESIYHATNDIIQGYDDNQYRVKYLDSEDIESFGFEYVWSEKTERIFKKDNIILTWWIDTIQVQINYGDNNKLFKGRIKNKSELKFILTSLGIL